MKKVISKRQVVRMSNWSKKATALDSPLHQTTPEEVLEKGPFIRKKYEDAVATLKRCPFPEELLSKSGKK
ncbi:hypothetical protein L3C95_15845 [Chitinophaga filiformis]|uniref:hypothetical protein n=1 Tax=Chitinophaga filiformis TaxID=104663 RepID=UPI001F35F412|nr:hypothetical protein [Chitinophaga filiformis]MCF6404370.1 hypothetical protein [Chitinophaga filiformis]